MNLILKLIQKKSYFVFICLSLMFLLFNTVSCSPAKLSSKNKKIDTHLVGVWQGSEKNAQFAGLEKKWITERKSDGTYTIEFTVLDEDDTTGEYKETFTEHGTWWVEGDIFYEYHDVSKKTDKYKYSVLNNNQVKFEMLKSAVEFNKKNYTFIDTRVE